MKGPHMIWGSYSGVAEEPIVLECDAVQIGISTRRDIPEALNLQ